MQTYGNHYLKNKAVDLLVPVAIWLALISICGSAGAAEGVATPTTLQGGKIVSAEEVKKLSDAKGSVFVDTRSPLNFGKGRVPGATSVAYREKSDKVPSFDASQDQFELSKLPADKNAKIVFYSDSQTGWKSYKAAVMSVNSGYKNVMYFRGGYADWVSKGYPEEK